MGVSQELRKVGATCAIDVDRIRHPRQLVDVLQPRVQRREVAPAPEPRSQVGIRTRLGSGEGNDRPQETRRNRRGTHNAAHIISTVTQGLVRFIFTSASDARAGQRACGACYTILEKANRVRAVRRNRDATACEYAPCAIYNKMYPLAFAKRLFSIFSLTIATQVHAFEQPLIGKTIRPLEYWAISYTHALPPGAADPSRNLGDIATPTHPLV